MIIKCSNCGARYRVSDDLVANGPKRFKCKNCGTTLLVKPPEAAKAPAQEQQPTAPSTPTETPQPPQEGQQSAAATPGPSAATAAETADTEETLSSDTTRQESATNQSGQASSRQDGLSPEEIAATQQQNIQQKLEERRRQMEDEISGRLNKAALETLDFDVLSELAHQIQEIQHNHDFQFDKESKLFSCIKCKTTFCLFPDDSRLCANCPGEISLVRADDILKQFGMFG